MPDKPAPAAVLFDGVCNLCNGAVNFILTRDPHGRFRFAALQSAAGQKLLERHGIRTDAFDTFVVVDERGAATRSTAALRIARRLKPPWPLLYAFIVVPRPLRDLVYTAVARNRYRFFGKRDTCRIPTAEERARFIGDDEMV